MDYSEEIPVKSAVFVRNLCKSYGDGPPILRSVCMNVKKGSVYGLLGPSGCGKTSLLSCIVGVYNWDSGEVTVSGNQLSSKGGRTLERKCGYMPQDVSLYGSLTFYEMAFFFGKLYNMSKPDVKCQVKFLAQLLQMTFTDKLIGTLSGGEQRRVSLALTLIHSPDLLILDEPTVGLDALLRKNIWDHLYNLAVNHGKTVIITTHYTEEAKLANKVGIMRNGRLLTEDTPDNLLQTFNCNLLEEVTLKLCRADQHANTNSPNIGAASNHKMTKFKCKSSWKETIANTVGVDVGHSSGVFKQSAKFDTLITEDLKTTNKRSNTFETSQHINFYHELKKLQGIAIVQSLNILRQKIFVAFLVILPLIQGSIIFNTVGRKPRDLNVGIVNDELLNWTSQCDAIQLQDKSCDFTFMSCKFIKEIQTNDIINLIPFSSVSDARTNIYQGNLKGYMTFPANFSSHTIETFATRSFASNESIDGSRIYMHLDFSQYIATLFMLQHLFESHTNYLARLADSCGMNGNNAKIPFEFKKPVYGSLDESYTEFFVPGLILVVIFTMANNITSLLYVEDRNNGTLGRGRVAGLKTVHVLLGYFITQGLLGLLQTFLWSLICYIWLGYSIRGQIWMCVLICLLVTISGIALGLLVGVVCSDAVQSLVFGIFLVATCFFFGGVTWPLEGMSKLPLYIAYFIPPTLPTLSLRSVVVRGLSLTHPLVWPGVVSTLSWIVVLVFILTVVYKR